MKIALNILHALLVGFFIASTNAEAQTALTAGEKLAAARTIVANMQILELFKVRGKKLYKSATEAGGVKAEDAPKFAKIYAGEVKALSKRILDSYAKQEALKFSDEQIVDILAVSKMPYFKALFLSVINGTTVPADFQISQAD